MTTGSQDFNYHAYIYETDNHPSRTPTSGGAAIGSGLNTLSNFNWLNFERVKWSECSNASGADCLTPKGFTFMRVSVDEGVYLDVYNMHADAGTEDRDLAARRSNLEQVSEYIETWSEGNAVLVYGDTNCRYTRAGDDVQGFVDRNGLTDPWVQLIHGGDVPTEESVCENPSTTNECEVVDKVFYRGSPIIELLATEFSYDSEGFLQEDGNILSDHNPIAVSLNWSLSDEFRQSNYLGGPHGTWFTDLTALNEKSAGTKASEITLRGAERLDSIGLTLDDGTSFVHGGTGGSETSLALAEDEYWTGAVLCQGKKGHRTRIFYVEATTSAGNVVSSGTETSECESFSAPDGWQIVGFLGRSGDEVDQLALIYAPQ